LWIGLSGARPDVPRYGRTRADSCQGDQFSRRWSLTIASLQEQRAWTLTEITSACVLHDRCGL